MSLSIELLANRILASLAYTSQFSYPLTSHELVRRTFLLTSARDVRNVKANAQNFGQAVGLLLRRGQIGTRENYLFLPGQENSIAIRKSRLKFSTKKKQEIASFLKFCSTLPLVEGVFITGALAMNNTPEDDDVDFLIITKTGRLWLARVILTFLAVSRGKRRSWRGEEKNSWCLNFWVEDNCLKLPSNKHSIYSAYELLQADPVINKHGVYTRWLKSNLWARKYLRAWYDESLALADKHQESTLLFSLLDFLENMLSWLLTGLNWLLYWLQVAYMKPHQTTELVKMNIAMFHPRDTKKMIETNWHAILKAVYELR